METRQRPAARRQKVWPILGGRAVRRTAQRLGDRAINRAAQILGPMLIVADGTLRSLRKFDYGEE